MLMLMLVTRFPGPALRRGHTWQDISGPKKFLQIALDRKKVDPTYRDLVRVGGARAPIIIPPPHHSHTLTLTHPFNLPYLKYFRGIWLCPPKSFSKTSTLPTTHSQPQSRSSFSKESFIWLLQSKTSHPHTFRTTSPKSLPGNLKISHGAFHLFVTLFSVLCNCLVW